MPLAIEFVKDGHEIGRCAACGLLARTRLPGEDELPLIYGAGYFRDDTGQASDGYADYLGDETMHRETARRRLALLERFTAPGGRLLDVGAAAGFFVHEAQARGWTAEGIDVSPEMVLWGRSRLGVVLATATVESSDVAAGSLSVVTMWDYLEHAIDPAADMQHCRRLLEPGGLLALSTGDADSAVARLSGARWHLLTPRHHNYFFSTRTLRLLLGRAGFEVLHLSHPGARYSIQHVAYKLDRMLRSRVTASLERVTRTSRVGRAAIPLNLFDIVTVVARKPTEGSRVSRR